MVVIVNNYRKSAIAIWLVTGLLILGSMGVFFTNNSSHDELPSGDAVASKDASSLADIQLTQPGADTSLQKAGASAEPDPQVVRQIKRNRLFDYSRSGNFEDTYQVLKTALIDGLISEDEYYGELAHMFHLPVSQAHRIISEIIGSGNGYGFEVLVASLEENYEVAKSMTANERQDVLNLLNKNKPEMVSDMSLLGVGSVSKYTSWVGSLRAFSNEENFVKNLNDLIENRISDPREAFGLYDILIKKQYSEKISNSAFKKYNFLIATYKDSYPENRMAELVSSGNW